MPWTRPRPMEVDALHTQDFSYDQAHQSSICTMRLCAISLMHKDSLMETSRWQQCHHCGQFGHKLVNCPERMLKCSSFDPREGVWGKGGWQTVGWSGAQGSAGGACGGKGGGVGFGGKGTYWFDDAPQGPPMLAWSGSETTSTQATNQGWNQVPGSWPLWAVHASAKIRASEAQEVPLQNRFEHLAEDDEGELPIPMTSEESVPVMVESSRSGQCQNKRDHSVYIPRAKPRKSQKERKRASTHCDTPPGLLCPLWHAQAEDLRKPLCLVNDYRSE